MHTPFPFVVVLAAATFSLTAPAARAFFTSATAVGYTSVDNGATQTPLIVTTTPTAGGGTAVSATGATTLSTTDAPASSASTSASASADPGGLHAQLHGLALIYPGDPNVPTITNGTPRTASSLSTSFSDTLHLGGSLPVGTPVSYVVTVHFSITSNSPDRNGGPDDVNGFDPARLNFSYFIGPSISFGASYPNGASTSIPRNYSFDAPYTLTGLVGDSLNLSANLSIGNDNRAGYYNPSFTYGPLSESIIDASHSLDLFADPLTPGLTITADSGHDYSTLPLPEPASFLSIACGLTLPILRRRRPPDQWKRSQS